MANFTPSNLVKAQARLKEQFTRSEFREQTLPALKLGLSNADPLIPNANQIRTREDRSVSGYALIRQDRSTSGVGRTYNHSGDRGDSLELPFTWTSYTDAFSISVKQMDNNVIGFEEALMTGFKNCILNIHQDIEADMVSNLLSNVTQVVSNSTPLGSRVAWNATNYAFEVSADDQKQFYQLAKMCMFGNKYAQGNFDVISATNLAANGEFWASQGAGNQFNTAFQFAGMNIAPSIDLTDANYGQGVSLVMPKNQFCLIDWIPKQNRAGRGDYNSVLGGYGAMADPTGTGLTFAIHGYTERANTASNNGVAQDDLMQFEVSVDVAFALCPLSTSNESVVYKIAQM